MKFSNFDQKVFNAKARLKTQHYLNKICKNNDFKVKDCIFDLKQEEVHPETDFVSNVLSVLFKNSVMF